jgi:hypothetical protein
MIQPSGTSHPRQERNLKDVAEARATRRAEIERRCMALDPPINQDILCHMESFQAALQIPTQLTENAWAVLKPRLLAQREAAEQRENERLEQSRILQAQTDERKQQEAHNKDAKDVLDREWDTIQAPVRNRLAAYANEIIQQKWAGGSIITKDSCSNFAADVLLSVRRKFYEEMAQNTQSPRMSLAENSPSHTLTLENMKWLFDNKVKNLTEHFQKELFLCNGCENNFKFYGFEGVIQHYAAKHTTALSNGSVVVHWRAEWPEISPFHPNPAKAKSAYYAIPTPHITTTQVQYNLSPLVAVSYGDYSQQPAAASSPLVPHGYTPIHYSSAAYPAYLQPATPISYSYDPNYQRQTTLFQGPYSAASQAGNFGAVNGYNAFSEHPSDLGQGVSYGPFHGYAPYHPQHIPSGPHPLQFQSIDPAFRQTGQGVELYQSHMNEMAKDARDIWFGTSGIKDIPQSVRIFVVIRHVVSRFEQKFKHEPSIAMFIDGLDHNALMRPVRSLNGLACKTCVTESSKSYANFQAHSQQPPSDRKLYTLPHLLNHFKSAHVETIAPIVDLKVGLEGTRMDWKNDMVELPEEPLIADLINAPGMDDAKLQLIAWVFPGVFPTPLPKMGSMNSSGPLPKYKRGSDPSAHQHDKQDLKTDHSRSQRYDIELIRNGNTQTDRFPILRTGSQSSSQTMEPPGEDEYDPHRPAFLGKIIESHQIVPRRLKPSTQFQARHCDQISLGNESTTSRDQTRMLELDRSCRDGFPADQVWRQSNDHFPLRVETEINRGETRSHGDTSINNTPQYISEDGELVEEKARKTETSSLGAAGLTEAERFLKEFKPGIEVFKQTNNSSRSAKEPPQDEGLRQVDSVAAPPKLQAVSPLAGPFKVASGEDTRYVHTMGQFNEHRRSDSRVQYMYTEESIGPNQPSPQMYEARCGPREVSVGRSSEFSRGGYNPQWTPAIHRSGTRSPPVASRAAAQYQAPSPHGFSHEPVYQIRPRSGHQDGSRHQEAINHTYSPIPESLSHDRSRGYVEDPYQRRVEYIPVRPENYGVHETNRYIIAPPVERRVAPDHVRVEPEYAERVYEREGHLYYAEPRHIDPRAVRRLESEYIEYRGGFR